MTQVSGAMTLELLSQDKKREVYLIHFNNTQKAL